MFSGPRLAPSAKYLVPGAGRPTGQDRNWDGLQRQGRRCAQVRQFLSRHFNCGFQHDQAHLLPSESGVGGRKSRLPFLSRLFRPLP